MPLIPSFAAPLWGLIGFIVCLAVLLFILLSTLRRKKDLEKFAAPKLLTGLTSNVSGSRRHLKNILFISGILFLFMALARPQYGERWIEVRRKGIDILIGMDVSKSMLVQDIKPNRLERAKLAVRDFVAKLEGDRVGLLPFAGTAFLLCPLTTDYDAFTASLDMLDVNSIPKGGTDLGAAIRKGGEVLSNEANHKILVLVTDGEDLSEDALKAAEEAKKQNMTVYTIGVGTPEGELIPTDEGRAGHFMKDEQGNFVTSKLDEQTLTVLAETTGGLYVPLGSMGQGFDTIYARKLALVPKEEHGQRKRKIPIERFPWPLGAAVIFLSMDFLLTGRRRDLSLRLPFVKTAGRRKKRVVQAGDLLLVGILLGGIYSQAQASEGEKLFQAGDYAGAESYYRKILEGEGGTNPALSFNLGGSLYRQQKYERAAAAFTQALITDDLSLQARSYYNRGNSQFFLGAAAKDKEQALQQWTAAKKSFEAALKLEPEDKAAAHNLEMIKKKLEQLKEQIRQSGQQFDNPQKGQDGRPRKEGNRKKQDKEQQNKERKKEEQQASDQEKQQNDQKQAGQEKGPGKQSDSAEERKSGQQEQEKKSGAADQKKTEQQKQKAGQKAVPEPKQQEEEAPAAEDIQKAAAARKKEQKEQQGKEKQMSAEDMERRMMGKMTEEEAKNLLNSLKGEQGELNFIPQGTGNKSVDKDW
ncbi:MAG: VWA domain-containing protein [Candidatus Electrothrix sp. EH2]|nr:VWA domain-containing protein [Candidatus Electrothrix sp. EH2]